ncbi:MAG: electron transfer flavoprotein subunit alpha/FixB family protein [Candidatus Hodgkinia cicadicola]
MKALVAIDALDPLTTARKLVSCASKLADRVDALALNCELARASQLTLGVHTLYVVACDRLVSKHSSSASLASLLAAIGLSYDIVLVNSTESWNSILGKTSASLNRPAISSVYAPASAKQGIFLRRAYAGKITQRVKCEYAKPWLLSIDTFSFDANNFNKPHAPAPNLQLIQHPLPQHSTPLRCRWPKRTTLPSLHEADIVVAGGKAFGSAEMFNKYLQPLATQLNAAIGASRAAVEAGYAPAEYQIGQTGKIIAPKLYIAFGISGSNHHMVGVSNSELILAVNTDANAPIAKLANHVVVADMFEFIPKALSLLPLAKLKQRKQ